MVLARNFKPGFRVELHMKDLANALAAAHAVGAPIPLTSQAMEILQALKVDGREKEDHSSIVHFFEKLANVEVKKKSEGSRGRPLETERSLTRPRRRARPVRVKSEETAGLTLLSCIVLRRWRCPCARCASSRPSSPPHDLRAPLA